MTKKTNKNHTSLLSGSGAMNQRQQKTATQLTLELPSKHFII